MLKVLLVLILIGYTFYKVTAFIFKGVFGRFTKRQPHSQRPYSSRKAPGSNLNIDVIPQNKPERGSNYSGGEYVDFEEVK